MAYKLFTAIIFTGQKHTKDNYSNNDITVYDYMFDSPDDTLAAVITNLLHTSKLIMAPIQRQASGSNNCGVFAIAVCMPILLKIIPVKSNLIKMQ